MGMGKGFIVFIFKDWIVGLLYLGRGGLDLFIFVDCTDSGVMVFVLLVML